LHACYYRLSWKVIVDQAASIARNGFPVSDDLAAAIETANFSNFDDKLQSLLVLHNGSRLAKGHNKKLPELAAILEVNNYDKDFIV